MSNIEQTKALLEPIITKPKLTDKLLEKPPPKFLFDIVTSVIKATGSFSDSFTPEDLDVDAFSNGKDSKLAFFNKLISEVSAKLGEPVVAKAAKIISGGEPENTNLLLQQFARAATATKTEAPKETSTKKKKAKKEETSVAEETPTTEEAPTPKKKKKAASKEEIATPSEEVATPKKKPTKKAADAGEKPKKKKSAAATEETGEKPKKKKSATTEETGEKPKKKKSAAATEETGEKPKRKKKVDGDEAEPKPKPKKKAAAETVETSESQAQEEVKSKKPEPSPSFTPSDVSDSPLSDAFLEQQRTSGGRPQSARPAPPRIQSNVKTVEKIHLDNVVPVSNATILTEGGVEDEQELDLGDDDEEQNTLSLSQSVDLSAISQDSDQHGGLVRDIIAANKNLESNEGGETGKKRETVRVDVLASKHQKEVLQKEVTKLRESIQVVCKSANPLGKTMDYLQEDFENMSKELEKWRQESATQQTKLVEEQRITETSLLPLNQKLLELDKQIADTLQKIHVTKTTVSKNDENIARMLALVCN